MMGIKLLMLFFGTNEYAMQKTYLLIQYLIIGTA